MINVTAVMLRVASRAGSKEIPFAELEQTRSDIGVAAGENKKILFLIMFMFKGHCKCTWRDRELNARHYLQQLRRSFSYRSPQIYAFS